jgi:hypothetical protein
MYGGYLLVETDKRHPKLVRIRETASAPPLPARERPGSVVRYAARFDDVSAARMHAHTALRHRLVDVDAGLYRSDPIAAVAAVDASDLTHRRFYLDPLLANDPALDTAIAYRRQRRRIVDRIWHIVGGLAILLLVVKLTLGF